MHTYLFTGTLLTLEPLAFSPPGHRGADHRSLLPRMPVPSAAGPVDTVYLAGSTLRGAYRHACAEVWLERAGAVTLQRFLELTVGGVKGSGEEPRVGLTERAAYLERDPFLALFGAGRSPIGWIHGRLDVGAALPDEPTQPVLVTGARGDATAEPMLLDALDADGRAAVLEGLEANRRRSRAAAEGRALSRRIREARRASEETTALERALDAARTAERDAASVQSQRLGSDVSLQMPLPGYEAIPPGTVLGHRMFCKPRHRAADGASDGRTRALRPRPALRRAPRARLRAGAHRLRGQAPRRSVCASGGGGVDRPRALGRRREQPECERCTRALARRVAGGAWMSGPMRLSDLVNAASAPSIAASLRKYGYDGPSADADAVARWLRAQASDIDTEVGAPAGTAAREARPDQRRFRRAVLDAYGGRCAVTGCNVAEALEAAHVADWRSENDVGAGLLLRVDLHRLLERGLLVIDRDWTVRAAPPWYRALVGRRLRLPPNRLHWPRLAPHEGGAAKQSAQC